VTPDVGINGLVYALPKKGDHIIMFSLDIKNVMPKSKGQPKGNAVRPVAKAAGPKHGFASTSEC